MLASSLERILRELPDEALLLDIGGWAAPLARADWVIDLLPYESRGLYGKAEGPERFNADTWVQRDICAREPWPFEDDQFDFVICSHTLEDVRDPVWVCAEINRVGKAGYIEVPSRLEEQSYGFQGPWVGWGHHHWLIDVTPGRIEFVFKHHIVHGPEANHFPAGFRERLGDEERVQQLWWEGGFEYDERVMTSAEEIDPYLAGFVARELERRPPRRARRGLRRR